jgi:hypothetical protein
VVGACEAKDGARGARQRSPLSNSSYEARGDHGYGCNVGLATCAWLLEVEALYALYFNRLPASSRDVKVALTTGILGETARRAELPCCNSDLDQSFAPYKHVTSERMTVDKSASEMYGTDAPRRTEHQYIIDAEERALDYVITGLFRGISGDATRER